MPSILVSRLRDSGIVRQFLRFAASGAVGTIIHYGLLVALREGLALDTVLASSVGFGCGAVVNYYLAHRVVFRSTARHQNAFPSFTLVALVGLALNSAIMFLLSERIGLHYLLAQLAATGVVLCWNFTVNRLWTFRE
jgi:putative flippase GtrA